MPRSSTVLVADEYGGNVEAIPEEDLGLPPERPRRRPGPKPRRKGASGTTVAEGDAVSSDGSLILATLVRSERARVIISIGEFEGRRRCDLRTWRAGIRGNSEFIPTYRGIGLQPDELDEAIAALTRARELLAVAGEGAGDGR